jgi:hypothetical protein
VSENGEKRDEKQEPNLTKPNYRDSANKKPGAKLNKVKQAERNAAIIQDYLSGMPYREIAPRYGLSKAALVPILNSEEAIKIREATFLKRVALLPKAYEVEARLLDSEDDKIALKASHKLFDDSGVGHSRTPHSVAINIFNQTVNQISQFMLDMVDSYGQEAMKKAAGQVIDVGNAEGSTNSEPDKQDVTGPELE